MQKLMIMRASAMQLPAILEAKKMGLYVAAVDSNPDAVGFNYVDEKVVISAIDIPAVVEAAKRIRPDGVITLCTDMPVRTVAAVAEELGLPAISVDNSICATDKIRMRETLRNYGVPVPHFIRTQNAEEYLRAVQEIRSLGYRCIVKPADNCGSRGVVLLDHYDKDYLLRQYAYSKNCSTSGEVVVEEYMEGPELAVETLNVDGVCHPIQLTDKLTTGAPYFVEMGHSQPSRLTREQQEDVRRVAVACNMALGNYNGSSNVEIKVTKDGAKVVEMGARLSGDYMATDLVPLSCGVNMVEGIIKIALGQTPDLEHKFERASAIRFVGADVGVVESIDGVDEARSVPGVVRVGLDRTVGDTIAPIHSSLDRAGYVIAQANDPTEAIRICEEAMAKIALTVR